MLRWLPRIWRTFAEEGIWHSRKGDDIDAAAGARWPVLRLRFFDGAVYAYKEVPEYVFRALVSSQSPGSYAHKHIFPVYEHERIDAA